MEQAMAADGAGNDILAVGVPVTGSIGIGPAGTTLPTDAQGGVTVLSPVLNVAIIKMGLLKTDGGPALVWGPTGDPLVFWQDGYSIPSGLATVTLTATFSEILSDKVRKVIAGVAPTADKLTIIDGGGHAVKYVIWIEEIFKNGAIRRRAINNAGILSVTEDKSTRGTDTGDVIVFTIPRDNTLGGHFREWVIPAP